MPSRVAALIVLLCCGPLAAATEFKSGPTRVALLELYTSEGCSSCPPADRWVSGLKNDTRLWHDVVPVAFHVDYWDGLGWKDRFATRQYSERQRDYARYGTLGTVYTPGFVVNGSEWRGWFHDPQLTLKPDVPAGRLSVTVANDQVLSRFVPTNGDDGRYQVHVAVTGSGLSTAVAAGENRGRELTHDFVVLGYETRTMRDLNGTLTARSKLPSSSPIEPDRRALSIWVTRGLDPTPVQATGGWLN